MNAPLILEQLKAAGVRVTRRGDNLLAAPKAAVTDALLAMMREHKAELLAALSAPYAASAPGIHGVDPDGLDLEAEARRERLLAMLERDPEARYAVLTADDGRGPVIVAIGIRDTATAEYEIERSRYDGILLLELIEKHSGTVH